jgi:hypothetical protein
LGSDTAGQDVAALFDTLRDRPQYCESIAEFFRGIPDDCGHVEILWNSDRIVGAVTEHPKGGDMVLCCKQGSSVVKDVWSNGGYGCFYAFAKEYASADSAEAPRDS